jgi:ribose transport system permease protein
MSPSTAVGATKVPDRPPETPTETARPARSLSVVIAEQLERFGLAILFGIVIVVFSLLRPDTFATSANWEAIATSEAVLGIAAVALIVPLVGGRFDVSVGSNMGLCAVVCAGLMSKSGLPLALAIVIAIALGGFVGIVNGMIVAYLGVNSIIATLGVGTVLGGLDEAYTHGIAISSGLSPELTNLSAKSILGLPALFCIMIVVAAAVWFVLTQTPFGRQLTATGSNMRAARLTGLNVGRIVWVSFITSGLLAGIGGVMQVGATGSGDPTVGGIGFIVPALAAVFLGATTWKPGTYNVPGAILALFFLGATVSGLVLVGVEPWVTNVFNGGAVVIAIIISAQFRRRRTGSAEVGS